MNLEELKKKMDEEHYIYDDTLATVPSPMPMPWPASSYTFSSWGTPSISRALWRAGPC